MRLTNNKGLSNVWVKAIENDQYDKVGDYSTTTLIGPPRIHFLKKIYDDRITEDVADMIWMLFGTALHGVLELAAGEDAITEQRITFTLCDRVISMKPDRVEPIQGSRDEYHLKDFKSTKVYGFIHPNWSYTAQANLYGYAFRKYADINVTKLSLEMLLKDWNKTDFLKKETFVVYDKKSGSKVTVPYPDSQVQVVELELWSDERCEEYLTERIEMFKACEGLSASDLPFCSPQERWAKPDTWAVKSIKKDGVVSSKAMSGGAGFGTEAEAQIFAQKKGGPGKTHIEFRAGKSPRCDSYCPVKEFCNQYLTEVAPEF